MKRYILLLFAIGITAMSSVSMAALSSSGVRRETRFLTDKMAYELNLNTAQYNDIYEINYDFIYNINRTMDYAVKGYAWAMDDYYDALDMRNDELRWVLSNSQYRRFMRLEYFYRPIYVARSNWSFRIYNNYVNRNQYFFPKPYHYSSSKGVNRRSNYNSNSYYKNRHKHDSYFNGNHSVRNNKVYQNNRRSDFGSVSVKPNSNTRPSNIKPSINTGSSARPSNNNNSNRPSNNNSTRPSSNSNSSSNTNSRPSSNNNSSRPTTNSSSQGSGSTSRPSTSGSSSSSSNRQSGTSTRPSNSTKTESSNSSNRRSESTSTRSNSSSSKRSTTKSSDDDSKTSTEKRSSSRRQ